MVPDAVGVADSVPLTPNGKVDRAAAGRFLDADPAGRPGADPAAAPRGPVETTLAAIWSELLRTDGIGRTDNFFALGGDSLLATRLVEAVRRELCAPVSLRLLLDAPTLAELAALVETRVAPAGPVEEGVL
jgi:aryl carrier-like protein